MIKSCYSIDEIEDGCNVTKAPLRVNTSLGLIEGYNMDGTERTVFRGIPFAQPPVKTLRWRPPQKVAPWAPKVLDATKFKATCLQLGPAWHTLKNIRFSSEDCLYLNIYAPLSGVASPGSTPLAPVMVYFPAGQFMWGAANDVENSIRPAQNQFGRDVIMVTVQYRLGPFGYLALQQLRERDPGVPGLTPGNSTGNYGTQDQRAALLWIQQNIHLFGGDKNRVMLWGESAGASIVTLQLVTPLSFGLYHAATIESGAFNPWAHKTLDTALTNGFVLAERVGCAHKIANKTHKHPAKWEINTTCLVMMPASKLLPFSDDGNTPAVLPYGDTIDKCTWSAVIDGKELVDKPFNLLKAGKVAPHVSVLMGSNRDDGSTFVFQQHGVGDSQRTRESIYDLALGRDLTHPQFSNWLNLLFGKNVSAHIASLYPVENCTKAKNKTVTCSKENRGVGLQSISNYWWAAANIIGDWLLTCPTQRAARILNSLDPPRPTFVYYFNHTPTYSLNVDHPNSLGAFHGADVPFFWYDEFELAGPGERELSTTILQYITNLAHTGNPNARGKLNCSTSRSFDDPLGGPYGCDAASGNMTIFDVLLTDTTSTSPGPWGPNHNASVTIQGALNDHAIIAGSVHVKVWELGVEKALYTADVPYFVCGHDSCDKSKPIALKLQAPNDASSDFELTVSFPLPNSTVSGIFTIVIWGSDQIEYPYDFTTNLHLRYGRLPPPQSSSTFPPPSPRVPVIWPRFATSGGAATAMVLGDNASVPFDPENNDVFPAPAPNVPSPAPTSSHPRRTQELGLWSPPVAYHAEAAGNSHASLFSDLKSKLCAFWEEFNHD